MAPAQGPGGSCRDNFRRGFGLGCDGGGLGSRGCAVRRQPNETGGEDEDDDDDDDDDGKIQFGITLHTSLRWHRTGTSTSLSSNPWHPWLAQALFFGVISGNLRSLQAAAKRQLRLPLTLDPRRCW